MQKRYHLSVWLIAIFPLLCWAKTSLWVAEKEHKRIFLGASVHLIPATQLPLPLAYEKVLQKSDRLVLELDFEKVTMLDQLKLAQLFRLPASQTLDRLLKPAVWDKLHSYMQQYHLPSYLLGFDAAYMSFILPILVWQQQGAVEGIDFILFRKAKEQHKEVIGLETFEQQMKALASLKKVEPNYLIEEMLVGLEDPLYSLDRLTQSIYRGDISIFLLWLAQSQQLPEVDQALRVSRNHQWVEQINQFFNEKGTTFVVVGALHFIGEQGILTLLEKQGFQVFYYEE